MVGESRTTVLLLSACWACSRSPAPAPSGASDVSPNPPGGAVSGATKAEVPPAGSCATSTEPQFSQWVDAPTVPFFLGSQALLSNGESVAVPHGDGFVQDGLLSWTADCATGDVFTGFAGSWSKWVWTIRHGGPGTRLFRLEGGRWRSPRLLPPGRSWLGPWSNGAALLAVPTSTGLGYTLEALGTGAGTPPSPAPGNIAGCPNRLGSPMLFASTSSGHAAVVGKPCGNEARFAVERFHEGDRSSVWIDVPRGVVPTGLSLAPGGALVLSGSREAAAFTARLRGENWEELRDLPGTPVSVALGPNAELWLVTAPGSSRCKPVPSDSPLSELWRHDGSGWTNVALPAADQARFVAVPATDDIWVGTERRLLRSRPATQALAWSRGPMCPLPATGAKPYAYGTASGGIRAEHPSRLVGSDCPHFVVVDETTTPASARFEAVLSRLAQAPLFARGLQMAFENYDRALADHSAPFGSPSPWVTFENGHYYWGIRLDPVSDHARVSAFLRREFPKAVRELCAAPFPIRLPSLTKTSAATAPR